MSVLIKGMEMPKNCDECVFYRKTDPVYDYCCISSATPKGCVPNDCPLVEVPTPHGRLIDADALLESIKEAKKKQPEISDVYDEDYFAVAEWVAYAPTVIKREGE